MKSQYAQVLHR